MGEKTYLGTINENSFKEYDKLHKSLVSVAEACSDSPGIASHFQILGYLPELVLSFAKFKKDVRVFLNVTPDISEYCRWGWRGSEPFLVAGSPAVVKDVRCGVWRDRETSKISVEFSYGIIFDHGFYTHYEHTSNTLTACKPSPGQEGIYWFSEEELTDTWGSDRFSETEISLDYYYTLKTIPGGEFWTRITPEKFTVVRLRPYSTIYSYKRENPYPLGSWECQEENFL